MSRLLSDEELRSAIAKAAEFSRSDGWYFDKVGEQLNATHKVEALEELFNTQKRLYAESVIGDDEAAAECSYLPPTLREMAGLSKDVRNQLRAEQRARIK